MKSLIIDVETTSFQHGNPFSRRNKLCLIGCYDGTVFKYWDIEFFQGQPYGNKIKEFASWVSNYDLLVGFNFKFDLHWLRRYGLNLSIHSIWDTQLCEFILGNQQEKYPSLASVCSKRSLGNKSDLLDTAFQSGLDTNQLPLDDVVTYLRRDCELTYRLYKEQELEISSKPFHKLFLNSCKDLLILEEMEANGLKYDLELSQQIGDKKLEEIKTIDTELNRLVSRNDVLWSSGDWLSVILYGGVLSRPSQMDYCFRYVDGREKIKTKWIDIEIQFERLVEPLKGSELKKDGFFKTDEKTLKRLKSSGKAKEIITLVLRRAKLEKSVGTYFHGIPSLYKEMEWEEEVIHGNLNQVVAITGRLSSSNPNQQNMDKEVRKCLVSRFPKNLSQQPR